MAIQLKQILDGKGIFIKLATVPDDSNYSDSSMHKPVYILNNKVPQIYLEKKGTKWFYSRETVEAIPFLYKLVYPFGSAVWVKLLPFKSGQTFLKLHYWQWLGFACIIGIFLLFYFLSRYSSYLLIKKIVEHKISNPFDDLDLLKSLANLFSLVVGFFLVQLFLPTLLLTTQLSASLTKAVMLVSAIVLILFIYRITELATRYAEQLAKRTPSALDDQLVQVLRRFAKLFIILFGVFYILRILDVNLTTVIAGISIGGLAIALAAQDTVKNFIGSLMIFADKPFRIGDTISGDNFEGTVLEVGFRSTRIKTGNDSVITVANGKLADMTIDNKGFRVFKKFKTDLAISYDTPLFKVEKFIEAIRNILVKYPYIKNTSIDVFLTNIQASGLIITVGYKYKVYNNKEELQHREFILLQILRLADMLHIKLFEQSQIFFDTKKEGTPSTTPEDVEQQLEKFFIAYTTQITNKI
ncbi:MAG: MscS Mechanosensitive ion channel [Bacteroidota bacterium]|nr:MscS Mechanosensitive ion channel [Bacteroidota bacterium]